MLAQETTPTSLPCRCSLPPPLLLMPALGRNLHGKPLLDVLGAQPRRRWHVVQPDPPLTPLWHRVLDLLRELAAARREGVDDLAGGLAELLAHLPLALLGDVEENGRAH